MVPNLIQDLQNLLFISFTSDTFLGVSDPFDSDVNFFNSLTKKKTKYFTADNITVN